MSGAGSKPLVPPGRQRETRDSASQKPRQGPLRSMASMEYSEQVGRCRHCRPISMERL
jgi:hypothetical protein